MVLMLLSSSLAATLQVGPGAYVTVQDAVNAASPGDTIQIEPGVYAGNTLVTTPDLSFEGSGLGVTRINGKVTIEADSTWRDLTLWPSSARTNLYVDDATVTLYNVELLRNVGNQPLIETAFLGDTEVTLEDCWLHDTTADTAISAIAGDTTKVVLRRTLVEGIVAHDAPIFVRADDAVLRILDTTMKDNEGDLASAVFLVTNDNNDSRLKVDRSVFQNNVGAGNTAVIDVEFNWPHDSRIQRNVFQDNSGGPALRATVDSYYYGYGYFGPATMLVRGNTFVSNENATGPSAIECPDRVHLWVTNNIFMDGVGTAVHTGNLLQQLDYNLYWGNTGDVSPGSVGANAVLADPMFVDWSNDGDPSNDDLTLLPGSPAFQAGNPLYLLGGVPRNIGASR